MPKVTVYVSDDQLDQLKAVRGFGRGGVSKLFQAFLESATSPAGGAPAGRYDYARKLMPLHAAVERHRRRLARKVQAGGPPADGGPVSAALAILLYKRLVAEDPARADAFEKEFARFGLDELVTSETEGVDLLAEPEETEEVDEDDDVPDFLTPLAGLRLGEGWQEALKGVQALKFGLRDLKHEERARDLRREVRLDERRATGRGRGGVRIVVSSGDDPRDVLTANDFETFTSRHGEWKPGSELTPSQLETVRELLVVRAGGDPAEPDDDQDSGGGPAPEGASGRAAGDAEQAEGEEGGE
jgi:hypothetical protein